MGSLVAALASFLDAKANEGAWLVRIDDIDPPREVAGAKAQILATLHAHGMSGDEELILQSSHHAAYETALEKLWQQGLLFVCSCTRTTLGPTGCCIRDCRDQARPQTVEGSLRIHVPTGTHIEFTDLVLGPQNVDLASQLSNFIVRRRDGLYAYQLAAAVDDFSPHITHVIRGADLLESTPRQMFLRRMLALPDPLYGHTPVLTDALGTKLSKQTGAAPVNNRLALDNLRFALTFLGQPKPDSHVSNVPDLLRSAVANWRRACLPK